jgi:hypothetical protein
MTDWFVNLGYDVQLATWLVASVLLYVIASQIAWYTQWASPGLDTAGAVVSFAEDDRVDNLDPEGEARWVGTLQRFRQQPLYPWVDEAARFGFYVGIPFLAMISGWLGADLLGISGTSWVEGKSAQGFLWEEWARGAGMATLAVLALTGVWLVARLVAHRGRLESITHYTSVSLWQRLLDVFYLQIHWAFYRSGPILWLNDLYWGTFVGLALFFFESALNPALWWSLKSPETAGATLFRLGTAWISALLFLATRNLWLTMAAHLVLTVVLARWIEGTPVSAERSLQ